MPGSNKRNRSHWPLVILSTFSTVIAVLLPLVLVRLLSPTEVGHFKVFALYLTILPAFSLTVGVMSGLAYWSGQKGRGRSAIRASSAAILVLSALFAAAAYCARGQIASVFGWNENEAALFAIALFGAIAGPFFDEAAIATGRIWTGALFYSGFEIARALSMLFAVFQFRSLTAVLAAHTIVTTLKVVSGYAAGYRLGLVRFAFNRRTMAAVWRYAFPVSLAWVFGIFANTADQFILSTSISPDEFALYSLGCLTIAPLLIFEQSVARVLIPQMSEAFNKDKHSQIAALYQTAVDNLAFILIPAVAGLMLFSRPIIELFYTSRYMAASRYLELYALTYLFLIIPYDAWPRARGESGWILRTFLFFSVVSLSLAYAFSRLWGPMGALTSLLVSGGAMRGYAIYYFRQESQIPLKQFLPVASIFRYACISALLAMLALSFRNDFTSERTWFFLCGSAFAAFYFIIALPLKRRVDRSRHPSHGVLIITQSVNIGGLERMVLHLCECLKAESRWTIHVLAYDQPADESQSLLPAFRGKDIPIEAFQKPEGFSFRVVYRILRNIFKNDIQVLHSQDLGGLIYAVCAKLLSLGSVKLVHTQHSFIHLERKGRYRLYEKLLTPFVDRLTVVSEDTRRTYLELGFPAERIALIQNGVDFMTEPPAPIGARARLKTVLANSQSDPVRERLLHLINDRWLVYVARFFPGKGQEHALRLWAELPAEVRSRCVLCYVGPESAPGEYEKIRAKISASPDSSRIVLVGPSHEPKRWLAAGDIYISCSEFEGMPLGPLEAVGAGLPTLLSAIPGHEFLATVSAQFPLEDAAAGARSLQELLLRVDQLGDAYYLELWNGSSFLRERYSIQRMAQQYSALYDCGDSAAAAGFPLLEGSLG